MALQLATDFAVFWELRYEKRPLFTIAYQLLAAYGEVSGQTVFCCWVADIPFATAKHSYTERCRQDHYLEGLCLSREEIVDQAAKSTTEGAAKSKMLKGQFNNAADALNKTMDDIDDKLQLTEDAIE